MFGGLKSIKFVNKLLPISTDNSRSRRKDLKIVVLGGHQTGKTSLIERYVGHRAVSETYKPTVGIQLEKVQSKNSGVWVNFWDISHAELGGPLEPIIFEGVDGVILMVDVTNFSTVQAIDLWRESISANKVDMEGIVPLFLFISKADLSPTPLLSDEALHTYCARSQIRAFARTTAKDPKNVERAFEMVIEYILTHETEVQSILEKRKWKLEQDSSTPMMHMNPTPALFANSALPKAYEHEWKASNANSHSFEDGHTLRAVKAKLAGLTDLLAKTVHNVEILGRVSFDTEEDTKEQEHKAALPISAIPREVLYRKRNELDSRIKALCLLLDYRSQINRFSDGVHAILAEATSLRDDIESLRLIAQEEQKYLY